MPKVVLKVPRVGMKFTQKPGDVIDVSEREACALIESGSARLCDGEAVAVAAANDAALANAVETAALDTERELPTVLSNRRRKRVTRKA